MIRQHTGLTMAVHGLIPDEDFTVSTLMNPLIEQLRVVRRDSVRGVLDRMVRDGKLTRVRRGSRGVEAAYSRAVPGQTWVKPSFPLPTVVQVLAVEGDEVTVKHGRKRPVTLARSLFLGQGFKPEGCRVD